MFSKTANHKLMQEQPWNQICSLDNDPSCQTIVDQNWPFHYLQKVQLSRDIVTHLQDSEQGSKDSVLSSSQQYKLI